jgi:hypothetical protein
MIWALLFLLNSAESSVCAMPCVCLMRRLEDDLLVAKDVVVGRVVRERMVPGPTGYPEREAVLVVTATWKGAAVRDTLTVRDPLAGMECDVGLLEGGRVLVFTRPESGRLLAMGCSRSRPVDSALGALDSLGPPRAGRVRAE